MDLDPDSRLIIVNLGDLLLCLSFLSHKTMTVSIYRAVRRKSQNNACTFGATFGTRKDLINACPLLLLTGTNCVNTCWLLIFTTHTKFLAKADNLGEYSSQN